MTYHFHLEIRIPNLFYFEPFLRVFGRFAKLQIWLMWEETLRSVSKQNYDVTFQTRNLISEHWNRSFALEEEEYLLLVE